MRRGRTGAHGRGGAVGLLQLAALVSTLDRFVMPPMLLAIATGLDATLADVVQAAGAYFLLYGLAQPVWGVVSDRLGRVATMRLTLLLAGVCSLAAAGATTVLVLTVTRALAGVFYSAAYPGALIYLGDTVQPEARQQAIARLMVGTAVGTAVASVGAGVLADLATWRLGFVVTGAASVAVAVVLRRLPEPPAASAARPSLPRTLVAVTRSRVTLLVLVFALLEGMVLLGGLTLLPSAAEDAGASTALAGSVTSVYGVAVLLTSGLVGALSRRWHAAWLVAVGASAALGAMASLTLSRGPVVVAFAAALIGVAWTAMHSTLQTWATAVLPAVRATVISLFALAMFSGSALTATLAAEPAGQGRYALVYQVGAVLAALLGLAATWARWRWRGGAQPADDRPDRD